MSAMTQPTFGDQLRGARERRRMTQQQLADVIGVDRKTVDNWENGRTSPRNRMGALKAWAPELGEGEPDPNEVEIRALAARLGLGPADEQAWVDRYVASKRQGEAAPRERAS